jgi:hypothetical protein
MTRQCNRKRHGIYGQIRAITAFNRLDGGFGDISSRYARHANRSTDGKKTMTTKHNCSAVAKLSQHVFCFSFKNKEIGPGMILAIPRTELSEAVRKTHESG